MSSLPPFNEEIDCFSASELHLRSNGIIYDLSSPISKPADGIVDLRGLAHRREILPDITSSSSDWMPRTELAKSGVSSPTAICPTMQLRLECTISWGLGAALVLGSQSRSSAGVSAPFTPVDTGTPTISSTSEAPCCDESEELIQPGGALSGVGLRGSRSRRDAVQIRYNLREFIVVDGHKRFSPRVTLEELVSSLPGFIRLP